MSEARLRTDLAMETMADARCDSGVKSEKSSCDGVERQCVTVENDRASRALGKAVGRYVTFSACAARKWTRRRAGSWPVRWPEMCAACCLLRGM